MKRISYKATLALVFGILFMYTVAIKAVPLVKTLKVSRQLLYSRMLLLILGVPLKN